MLWFQLLALAVAALVARFLLRRYTDPLNRFPAPPGAAWTDAWRVVNTYSGFDKEPSLVELHRKLGDVVRIAPNALSFADPQAIPDIYGNDKHFSKSDYYSVAASVAQGRPNPTLFSSVDYAWHERFRRTVQPIFNLSALVQYETFVSDTVVTFSNELSRRYADRSGADGVFDLSQWMHYYAQDIIGELTYGSRFGFLESASDIADMIASTRRTVHHRHVIGQAPWLDKILEKNPILLWLNRRGILITSPDPAVSWCLSRSTARVKENADMPGKKDDSARPDLLSKFLQAREDRPDIVGDKEVLAMGLSMVFAGSESTAVTLTAIFYYLLKHPEVYANLQRELDKSLEDLRLEDPVPFKTAQNLPYLNACIQEAFRLHPAARFGGERVVPVEGARIAGKDIPGGTKVAVLAWVVHRNEDVFGSDVDRYRPERWLLNPEADQNEERARLARMNRTMLQFGAGKHTCIGRHISSLEMLKVVPSLLRAYQFDLVDKEAQWKMEIGSFATVSGVNVRIRTRAV